MSLNTDFRKSQMTFGTAGGSEPVRLGAFGEEHCFFFNICMLGLKHIEHSVYMGRCSMTDRRRTSDFHTCYFSTGIVGNFYINVNMGIQSFISLECFESILCPMLWLVPQR